MGMLIKKNYHPYILKRSLFGLICEQIINISQWNETGHNSAVNGEHRTAVVNDFSYPELENVEVGDFWF